MNNNKYDIDYCARDPWYRVWEIIPGLSSITTLFLALIGTIFWPKYFVIFMLIFTLYWFVKLLRMNWFIVFGAIRYKKESKIDWLDKVTVDFPDYWKNFYHLVIIPTYKEDITIIQRNIDAIESSNYPNKKIIIHVAFEERDKERAVEYEAKLSNIYKGKFFGFETSIHPGDIPGEIRGKGPNITWAGRKAEKYLKELKLPYSKVICTTLDADNRVDRNYFANLMWNFLNCDDPYHTSFQPIPMYFNNIWKVSLPIKLISLGSSFWQLVVAIKPHYARNFAAHAQPFDALIATDFWSTRTIVEDGHQYWRSFFTFHGNHWVLPLFVPIYMDAIEGDNLYEACVDQYLQRRRWFWGASDIPYVFVNTIRDKSIGFIHKWLWFIRLFDSNYSLAVYSFLLSMGWFPFIFSHAFNNTVIAYNFQLTYRILLYATSIGMVVTIILATILVPPRPGAKKYYIGSMLLQWIFTPIVLPVVSFIFSSLPALDSQIRLMIGKPFTVFNVTKKKPLASPVAAEPTVPN